MEVSQIVERPPGRPATLPPKPKQPESVPFEALKLPVGIALQIQMASDNSDRRFAVRLLGFREKKSLTITTPEERGSPLLLREGQDLVIRFFFGKFAYAFNASVLRVCHSPYPYLHLSYPAQVQGVSVRASERIKVDLPATATLQDGQSIPCQIVDLSLTGAMIDSNQPLGTTGDVIAVSFRVPILDTEEELAPRFVVIRSIQEQQQGSGASLHHHGIAFRYLSMFEQLVIQNCIYRQLLDR